MYQKKSLWRDLQNKTVHYQILCMHAYKSFLSGMLDQQSIPVSSEEGDVTTLLKTSLTFGPNPARAIREVGILAADKDAPLSQGRIDLIVHAADRRGIVAIKDSPKQQKLPDDNLIAWKTSATSVKMPESFSSKGCIRQYITELLALTEVLKQINTSIYPQTLQHVILCVLLYISSQSLMRSKLIVGWFDCLKEAY